MSQSQDHAGEIDQSTHAAMLGDRDESIAMWQAVADGRLTAEVQVWLRHVAEAVLDAESKPAGRLRDGAIVRALGLAGKTDKHRELRDFVSILSEFTAINEHGSTVERASISPAVLARRVREEGRSAGWPEQYEDLSDHELAKLIGEQLRKPKT